VVVILVAAAPATGLPSWPSPLPPTSADQSGTSATGC
jgi:hypothetical protein